MRQNKNLNLSSFISSLDTSTENLEELPDDLEHVKEYGIGIDCHSRFIEVCIRYRNGDLIQKSQAHFSTKWDDLVSGREWCINILKTKASPVPDLSEPLHYLLESTANYHMPICMAWGGNPTIINPTIAGATKRKTDVLDSRLLALHDQLNIWREYVFSPLRHRSASLQQSYGLPGSLPRDVSVMRRLYPPTAVSIRVSKSVPEKLQVP